MMVGTQVGRAHEGIGSAFFSVVVPAYNAEATLSETIESVLAQTYEQFELVVVDDGSTDRTAEIVAGYAAADGRVMLVEQENGGIARAYNAGIAAAAGAWIVMLSADDLLDPAHLATYSEAISKEPVKTLWTSNGIYLYDDGYIEPAYQGDPWFGLDGCELSELFSRCFYPVGAAFRREDWVQVGGIEPAFYAEDYLFFLRLIAEGGRHGYLPPILSTHRRNRRQRSAAGLAMREGDLATIIRISEEYALTAIEREAFERSARALERNIARRRLLYRLLGTTMGERTATQLGRVRRRATRG